MFTLSKGERGWRKRIKFSTHFVKEYDWKGKKKLLTHLKGGEGSNNCKIIIHQFSKKKRLKGKTNKL
jgi:hypothetical protein